MICMPFLFISSKIVAISFTNLTRAKLISNKESMPYVDCVSELSILDCPRPSLPNTPHPPNVDCPLPPSIFSSVDSIQCSFNCDYVEDDLL